ncbi:class I SAM-dependent methyltransferase [Halobacillus sp. A5]|uniref:class I SAM-dependent methyltransferase n=1 Tax=Halobacillus sp. A5 TaxID=2880263 RepID=UPI0020A6780D|nr:class I SAM-dependent methyltransferase [Halobacillus sp. A5]MCP3029508.1 class I SAM-dependent methyltransferase [Halobacillus sp. A5]
MKITDYEKVAHVYDKNPFRFEEVETDSDLINLINNTPGSTYNILDLACGTGIYLKHQTETFKAYNIHWHGFDASQGMLAKAKDKVKNVTFVHGRAESMPYEDEAFDYITNHYAFHHFVEKDKALDEIHRVLKTDGVFKLRNINIYGMKNWWVYHYFPSALMEDYKRFWSHDMLFRELSSRGFDVRIECSYKMENIKAADYVHHVANRDISVLTLIDDEEYEHGFDKMKQDIRHDPGIKVINDFSELVCTARKD